MTSLNIQAAMDYIDEKTKNIKHSKGTFKDHLVGTYNLLKELNQREEVCLAGLFHSIYDTEFFKAGIHPSEEEIINLIGEYANDLVVVFCKDRRDDIIMNNRLKFNTRKHLDLLYILLANEVEQQTSSNIEPALNSIRDKIRRLEQELSPNKKFEVFTLNNKKICVFDNFLERYHVEYLANLVFESHYKPGHWSSQFSPETDERFVCYLEQKEFRESLLPSMIQMFADEIKVDFTIGVCYLNHYGQLARVNKHTDGAIEDGFTILFFPNTFWEDTWGGDIKFYNEEGSNHYSFDFKPGRVIIFDGRLSHQVMPITAYAKRDRFSIAVKGRFGQNGTPDDLGVVTYNRDLD
jgi:Rps23 Pro-64 3,4-dihydroxylase Tpa1-like proline 4-hydroxylase